MASLIYRQLLTNSFTVDLSDEISSIGQEKNANVTVNPGPFAQTGYAPVEWGPGQTNQSTYEQPTLDGPYNPDTFEAPQDIWVMVEAEQPGVMLAARKEDSSFIIALIMVEPGVQTTTRRYNVFGTTYDFQVSNSGTAHYKLVSYEKTTPTGNFNMHWGLTSTHKLNALMVHNNHVYLIAGDTPNGYTVGVKIDTNKMFFEVNFPFYTVIRSKETELKNLVNNGLPPVQDVRFITPVDYSLRLTALSSKALPNEDIEIAKTSLWKEMQYNRDIKIQFKFGNNIIKAGGLGYKWSEMTFKPANHTYTYERDGEQITAHTTCSVNGVNIFSCSTGGLPTDFAVNSFEVIKENSLVFIDYWDDSIAFRNMVYVRSLNAQMEEKQIIGGAYDFKLTIGAWPVMRGGSVIMQLQRIGLSTQFTDFVSLNSLRFTFRLSVAEPFFEIARTRMTRLYGLPAGNPNNVTTTNADPFHEINGRYSLISLVPSNDDYQTPIFNSVTVRQDLERQLSDLRDEFNELSREIATAQLVDLALLPLDMFSMFSGIKATFQSLKSLSVSVMKKFKTSKIAGAITDITDSLSDAASSISRSSSIRSTTTLSTTVSSVSDLADDITDNLSSRVSQTSRSLRLREFTTQTDSVKFDDISAAVLKAKLSKSTQVTTDMLPDVITEAADKFIPNRAYRVLDGDVAMEVTTDGKYIAYLVDTFEEIPFDANKFFDLVTDSPVLAGIIDFKTIKNLNDNFGITRKQAFDLLRSDPRVLRDFINQKNPIIKYRIDQLIQQCRL
nr:VP4 [Rotavirus A]